MPGTGSGAHWEPESISFSLGRFPFVRADGNLGDSPAARVTWRPANCRRPIGDRQRFGANQRHDNAGETVRLHRAPRAPLHDARHASRSAACTARG